jgi:hypothetical protein
MKKMLSFLVLVIVSVVIMLVLDKYVSDFFTTLTIFIVGIVPATAYLILKITGINFFSKSTYLFK